MTRQSAQVEPRRSLLRGICLVVTGDQRLDQRKPATHPSRTVELPRRRPDTGVLSESIPLFFIARNRVSLWVAREAEGRTGGIFLLKTSALRFANRNSAPSGCATMFLAERLELDVENRGNRLMGWIGAALKAVAGHVPKYPPSIPITPRKEKGEWQ
jgi:hypothetical protein